MIDKRILITGGLGFIGRTLLEALTIQNFGAKLYAIDIKDMPKDAELLKHNVDFQRLDIRDEIAVKNYIMTSADAETKRYEIMNAKQ
ncbi:MAG: NAD(P)-dependent oxidoreductase, partial [Bacteroidales bacterium]|nr:NAD(P)-dependent oxidoreductase [Bacteroidales bacterium]